jgi:membrane protease YdiL (CAAX protease family)
MRLRTLLTAALTAALTLVVAAPAMAAGGAGEGWAGETDDKIVTFFCLGVLLFFVMVVIVGSTIQGRLEKRKDEKKAAQALARVGW